MGTEGSSPRNRGRCMIRFLPEEADCEDPTEGERDLLETEEEREAEVSAVEVKVVTRPPRDVQSSAC